MSAASLTETATAQERYTAVRDIHDLGLRVRDRKRQLVNVIAELTQQVIEMPNVNVTELTVTTSPLPEREGLSGVTVRVSAPKYTMAETY